MNKELENFYLELKRLESQTDGTWKVTYEKLRDHFSEMDRDEFNRKVVQLMRLGYITIKAGLYQFRTHKA